MKTATGKFSTYLAITSFGIGTLLLLIHFSFQDNLEIMITGFFYVLVAILLNGITLIHLLYHFIINRLEREIIAIRMLILLANIPITLLYINIVFHNNLF
ncbi:hypothetical protein L1S35_11395 [Flavobacterium sp. AS60]|uniref:hypothetical protein n=1 Tax=Flavobacterium anseongense TaxID=2910677 RepID=UPI001F27C3F9|nr:hypothetical protein [Flavobacterium sp. AS60]MCF6130279.1 hypothetical protein [Flavobacterium sp. AS60]